MDSGSQDKTDDDAWPLNVCFYCKLERNTHDEILKHMRKSSPCRRIYEGEEDILPWNKCPGCKSPYKKILLHLKKSDKCRSVVTEKEYGKFVERSKLNRRLKNRRNQCNRRTKKAEKDPELKEAEVVKNKEYRKIQRDMNPNDYKQKQNYWNRKSREKARKVDHDEVKKNQNDCKAKSRTKAREEDYDKTRKVQNESSAKWRAKKRSENIEFYKARQQLWKAKARRVEKFKNLSKNLKKNIGALIERWDSDEKNGDNKSRNSGFLKKIIFYLTFFGL